MSKRLKDSWGEFAAEADKACGLRGVPLLSVSELVALAERRGLTVLRRGRPTTSAEIRALSNRLPMRPIGPLEISQGREPQCPALGLRTGHGD